MLENTKEELEHHKNTMLLYIAREARTLCIIVYMFFTKRRAKTS